MSSKSYKKSPTGTFWILTTLNGDFVKIDDATGAAVATNKFSLTLSYGLFPTAISLDGLTVLVTIYDSGTNLPGLGFLDPVTLIPTATV